MDIDRFLNSCSIPGMGSEDVPLMVHFGENVPVCLPTGRTVQYSDFMPWIEGSEPHEYRNPHNEGQLLPHFDRHAWERVYAVENKSLSRIVAARHSLFGLTESTFLKYIDPEREDPATIMHRNGWTDYSRQENETPNLLVQELIEQYRASRYTQ